MRSYADFFRAHINQRCEGASACNHPSSTWGALRSICAHSFLAQPIRDLVADQGEVVALAVLRAAFVPVSNLPRLKNE